MKKHIYFYLILLISNYGRIYGQSFIDTNLVANYDSVYTYYKFKPNLNISPVNLVTGYSSTFRVSNGSSLIQTDSKPNQLTGGNTYRFKQMFKGVEVEYAMLNVSYDAANHPQTANGKIYQNINTGIQPQISASQAINSALAAHPAVKCYWQDTTMENEIKIQTGDPNATYYPSAKLIILPLSQNPSNYNYALCYKIKVWCQEPLDINEVFVDALNGTILKTEPIPTGCNNVTNNHTNKNSDKHTGTTSKCETETSSVACSPGGCQQGAGNLHKYGWQSIYTDKFKYGVLQTCTYRLKDNCTGTTLYTRKYIWPHNTISDIRDNSNTWTTSGDDQDGITAHWSLERTHDFFRYRYGRNGYDGNYSQISIYLNALDPNQNDNAYFSGNSIVITKRYNWQHPIMFLDGIGHEYTHGITNTTSGLRTTGEEGAINEGFSDIFGTMVEYYGNSNYSTGQTANYRIFELSNVSNNGIRNMENPKQFGHPDTYMGVNWQTITGNPTKNNDFDGVHSNCEIVGRWFYLISEGYNGRNDKGDYYCVRPIGREKAADIAWNALTTKFYPTVDFNACRYLTIQAASDLYGAASDEVAQVTAAWYAVGVGGPFTGQVNYSNQTVNSQTDIHYNSKVSLQNVTANAPSLYVTSNTEIELINDVNLNAGSWVELYIAPVNCSGASRFINPNGDGSGRGQTANATTQSNFARSAVPVIITENDNRDNTYIQPNPSNGVFTLLLNENRETPQSVTVLDYQGRVVKEISNINRYELDMNITELNTGIYFVKITYPDAVLLKKIIKN